jgi:hypothetical protein
MAIPITTSTTTQQSQLTLNQRNSHSINATHNQSAAIKMKSSTTAAAIFALSSPALAVNSRWSPVEAINIATGKSIGYLWSEANGLQYSNPVYGDERFDFMFINDGPKSNQQATNLKAVEVSDEPSAAVMRCARESPSPCSGSAYFEVGGGQWEAGHYLVRGGFRYSNAPGYKLDEGFYVDNYNNATGHLDFKYTGTNDRNEEYAFYGMSLNSKTKHYTQR